MRTPDIIRYIDDRLDATIDETRRTVDDPLAVISRLVAIALDSDADDGTTADCLQEIAMRLQVAGYGAVSVPEWSYVHGAAVTPESDAEIRRRLGRRDEPSCEPHTHPDPTPSAPHTCPFCDGVGRETCATCWDDIESCYACGGAGAVECEECDGTGEVGYDPSYYYGGSRAWSEHDR